MRPLPRPLLVLAAAALTAGLAACQNDDDADMQAAPAAGMGTMNDACPFTDAAVTDGSPTAEWNGGTVGFCCNGCKGRWAAMSDAERRELMSG